MQIIRNEKQGKSYNHASEQKGWRNDSPRVGFNEGQLKDEQYDQVLAIHNPHWRYIILHFPQEAQCPVTVLGYNSIPIAIELSQWTYPVTFMTTSIEGVKKVERDAEIHAGTFQDIHYIDFLQTLPRGRVVTFINILGQLSPSGMFSFIDMALRRSQEVVASEKHTKDWFDILNKRYDVAVIPYEEKKWNLLIIKQKLPPLEA